MRSLHETQIDQFKDRLKLAIGNESIRSFSKRCEISDTVIRKYLNGSLPVLDKLPKIAEATGKSMEWLVTGEERTDSPLSSALTENVNKDLVTIPQYDLRASAGAGCLVLSENPVAEFSFSRDWLIKQGLNGARLTVIPVHGDSMEPTLMDEDLMLVKLIDDPKDGRDGICIIRIDDDILVKRIQYDFMEQGYHIRSDNTAYSPFFVGSNFKDRFSVIGRMVRVLQRAKLSA